MEHHICMGTCGGSSESPGVCQAQGCVNQGKSLEKCDCQDGKHYGRQEKSDQGQEDYQVPQ